MKLSFAVSRERVSWPKPKIEFKSFRPFIAGIYSSHSNLELVQKHLTGQYCSLTHCFSNASQMKNQQPYYAVPPSLSNCRTHHHDIPKAASVPDKVVDF